MKVIGGAAGAAALLLSGCAWLQPAPQASASLRPASGSQVRGDLTFRQAGPNRVRVAGQISGHTPGAKGFHIHEKGDCSAPDATSAGGHFNPAGAKHGASTTTGHAGDMGNITFNQSGAVAVDMVLDGLTLERGASNSILGRAVVVHMQPDDLKSDPTGNAGGRAACGVIG